MSFALEVQDAQKALVPMISVTLVVRNYDVAIAFYVEHLGFELVEDTYQSRDTRGVAWLTNR
ncbi:VOC family protein [Neorhizobium petrolearium]|uniref:VOC family protein n=1 Tax=Neorhizobium petrolearium TaxID=515361 RepID=UPI003F5CE654